MELSDIEAISGATITSEAVVEAINNAYKELASGEAEPEEETPAAEEPKAEEPAGKAVKGTGDGYGGDVNVEAVFAEDGEIKSLKIDEEDFMETAGIGTRVLEEESFINSFIGKKAPIKIDDIEAVSGATITSEAVVDAVNDAFEKAGAETKEEPAAEEPAVGAKEEELETEPAGEAVKGTGDGYGGDVNVEAVFAEDGEIKSLKIDEEDFMETAGIGTRVLEEESFINSFIGKKAPIKIDDIEAVSGATITSEAVVDAVNDAFEKIGSEPEAEEPAAETKEEPAGKAVKGTGDGYGGDVNVEAVFSEDGEIKSLKINEEDFMETAGIGTRVLEEESFINSFIGKKAPIKIDDIEAVSGATITSEAVVDAVNDAFEKAGAETKEEPVAEEPAAEAKEEPAGEAVKGTGDGYGGDVNVEAVFSEDGEIKSLKIDEEDFMETAGIGTRVLEEESFINSFIGKKVPIKIDDIEAVSGATITSEAVVDAVNDAFEKAGVETKKEPVAEEPKAEEPAGEAVKGTGDGYGGDVNVEAVFSEDGEIKSLKIDEEDFMETAGIGTRVLEEESFINSFIGKKAPINIDDIEAVSGATITSEAVVDAVNDAFEKIGSEPEAEEPAAETKEEETEIEPEAEEPAGEAVKGTGDGYGGDVNVEAVFAEDGEIKSLKIDEEDFMETAGIGTRVLEEESFINSFIGKKAPIKIDDIEAVSGATITSEAVVDAVNDAFEKASAEPAGEAVKGTGDGYGGDVNVEAVFSEDGEIKSLKIDEEDFMETAGIGTRVLEEESFINSFIGKKAPIKIDDIEAVSGATITSEAVVDAVNDAFNNR
jgi:Na+-translocating ferredoxin:NAD+ oxidoreductase RnfG subunit